MFSVNGPLELKHVGNLTIRVREFFVFFFLSSCVNSNIGSRTAHFKRCADYIKSLCHCCLVQTGPGNDSNTKQECIPVGCVPTAAVATAGSQFRGVFVWRAVSVQRRNPCSGSVFGGGGLEERRPHVNRMTDRRL